MSEIGRSAQEAIVEISEVTKNYGPTIALAGVNLKLHPGSVHALMGENGAGKSTLVRILVGATQPTDGKLSLEGNETQFLNVSDAIESGIIPIYQHLTLFNELSVLENLFSFDTATSGFWPPHLSQSASERAKESLKRVGLSVELDRKVSTLKLGERQLLEIARGLIRKCKVLLLDEPTAALNSSEADRLLEVVRDLSAEGVAIVYISHKSDEIRNVADVVTVLRDGKSVISGIPIEETTIEALVEAMLGQAFEVDDKYLPPPGEVLVQAKNLVLAPDAAPISFSVSSGEVLGIVGLAGSGAEEIGQVLAGAKRMLAGSILIEGKSLKQYTRSTSVKMGIGYVPSDRHEEGLFELHSALSNASASIHKAISKYSFLSRRKEKSSFTESFDYLSLSPNEPDQEIQFFSGGNQQKILVARNLAIVGLKILILSEPTRGVDIAARDKIHDAIVEAVHSGKAIVLITSDLEELTSLAHRILIIENHQISHELPQFSTPDNIAFAMQERGKA